MDDTDATEMTQSTTLTENQSFLLKLLFDFNNQIHLFYELQLPLLENVHCA